MEQNQSSLELEMLQYIRSHMDCHRYEVLNHFRGQILQADSLLENLIRNGSIILKNPASPALSVVELSPQAESSLLSAEKHMADVAAEKAEQKARNDAAEAVRLAERAQDRSDEERRYHGQNRITIIASLLSFVLGVLVEHFTGIVAFLSSHF